MREVAQQAGVSLKTVSRVINRETGVSDRLIAKVQDAIRDLEYQHNIAASQLRRSNPRTATIGLLLDDVSNPFSSTLHRAVEDVARLHKSLVFASSNADEPQREEETILALASRRVDGLITVPASRDGGGLRTMQRLGKPIVFVDRLATFHEADHVVVDNRAGANAAIRHLAQHQHRRIAYLGDSTTKWTATERHLGYVEGMAIEGMRFDPAIVRQNIISIEQAEEATTAILTQAEPPTALFTSQNLITVGAIRALQKLNLQHRIALVGFDDFILADLLDPGVTVIAQDPAALGKCAAEILFARLDGDRQPSRHEVIPTCLIVRGSGEILPGIVRN